MLVFCVCGICHPPLPNVPCRNPIPYAQSTFCWCIPVLTVARCVCASSYSHINPSPNLVIQTKQGKGGSTVNPLPCDRYVTVNAPLCVHTTRGGGSLGTDLFSIRSISCPQSTQDTYSNGSGCCWRSSWCFFLRDMSVANVVRKCEAN